MFKWYYKYKQYIVKHNSINDFIKVYFFPPAGISNFMKA
jgi:hypothetical protein